jgi:transcriptional antiterminator NusG
MNEFEQNAPDTAETIDAAVEEQNPTTEDLTGATESALDITMGDMETDLPAAASAEVAPAAEIEIPWGDMTAEAETKVEAEKDNDAMANSAQDEPVAADDASQESEPEPDAPVKRVWYVVHCYSGYENKVKKGLEQRINSLSLQNSIFRVVVPIEREVEIREGQRKNIERRVFPGYILVEMMELVDRETLTADATEAQKKLAAQSDEVWYAVRNTPGVTGFVSSGDQQRPVPLRQDEVDKILKRMESEEPKVHVSFRVGQAVNIIDGPFAEFKGNVEAVDMLKGKVRVLVSFFGRETPVELDLLQVEKV